MTLTFLKGTQACSSTVRDARAPAWPNLHPADTLDQRNRTWSAADARRGIHPPAAALRGGLTYVPDPLAERMTARKWCTPQCPCSNPTGGTSLFR